MEPTIEARFSRIKKRLTRGREILAAIHESDMNPYEVPDVTVDRDKPSQPSFTSTQVHLFPPVLIPYLSS